MSMDRLFGVDPELVVVLQLEGAGLMTKAEARKNVKRLLPDFTWDEPETVHPPFFDKSRQWLGGPTWTTNATE